MYSNHLLVSAPLGSWPFKSKVPVRACVCVCYACVLGYVPNANIIQAKDLMKRAQAIRISQFMTQEYGIAGYKWILS